MTGPVLDRRSWRITHKKAIFPATAQKIPQSARRNVGNSVVHDVHKTLTGNQWQIEDESPRRERFSKGAREVTSSTPALHGGSIVWGLAVMKMTIINPTETCDLKALGRSPRNRIAEEHPLLSPTHDPSWPASVFIHSAGLFSCVRDWVDR